MKSKMGAYLMMLAGIMMLLSGCGGDGGGFFFTTPAPVAVRSLKNPVLVTYSTTVVANFANYTSTVKFGSTVTFTVAPPATFSHVSSITTRAVTNPGGRIGMGKCKKPLAGNIYRLGEFRRPCGKYSRFVHQSAGDREGAGRAQ